MAGPQEPALIPHPFAPATFELSREGVAPDETQRPSICEFDTMDFFAQLFRSHCLKSGTDIVDE
jgi:hypothetical protein